MTDFYLVPKGTIYVIMSWMSVCMHLNKLKWLRNGDDVVGITLRNMSGQFSTSLW